MTVYWTGVVHGLMFAYTPSLVFLAWILWSGGVSDEDGNG